MALIQRDLFNSPYSGIFCVTSEKLTLLPPGLSEEEYRDIGKALDTEVEIITVGGSRVIGSLICLNDNGLVCSNIATERERERIEEICKKKEMEFMILNDRNNAAGNNLLINNKSGFCNPKIMIKNREEIEKTLKIEIIPKEFIGIETVGMLGCFSSTGALVHPELNEEDRDIMKDIIGIEIRDGTVAFGMPLIGAGLVCNSKGGVCGTNSTGIELGQIEEAMHLY